jgi:type IV secretion system protein VirB2
MRNEHVALLSLTLCTLFLAQSEPALAQVVFTKAETVATGVLASFRGTLGVDKTWGSSSSLWPVLR